MANKTITIRWSHGNPHFAPPPGVTHLKYGDRVTVQLRDVSQGAVMSELTIYGNKVGPDGNNEKDPDNVVCTFVRKDQEGCGVYELLDFGPQQIVFRNIDRPDEVATYWFGVSGQPGDWEVDPELQNEPDSGPGI